MNFYCDLRFIVFLELFLVLKVYLNCWMILFVIFNLLVVEFLRKLVNVWGFECLKIICMCILNNFCNLIIYI